MNADPQFEFHAVALPDGKSVELALPAASTDPVVQGYAANRYLNQYLVDLLLRFTEPGGRVLDLGCHVGTLSVPAAALGRNVLAVDASPLHVASVRLAAERNRLDSLRVEWCAVAEQAGEIAFNENGLWGMVARDDGTHAGMLKVPARRADELVKAAGWSRVDLVKMDVEGSELAAIESLGDLLLGPGAPVVIYESNGMTFEIFGYTIADFRRRLERIGYITCRVEKGALVYCPPIELQPEAWLDLVALPPPWQLKAAPIVPAWPVAEMVRRCVEWGASEHPNVREYLHKAFASRVEFPKEDAQIVELRRVLAAEFGNTS